MEHTTQHTTGTVTAWREKETSMLANLRTKQTNAKRRISQMRCCYSTPDAGKQKLTSTVQIGKAGRVRCTIHGERYTATRDTNAAEVLLLLNSEAPCTLADHLVESAKRTIRRAVALFAARVKYGSLFARVYVSPSGVVRLADPYAVKTPPYMVGCVL